MIDERHELVAGVGQRRARLVMEQESADVEVAWKLHVFGHFPAHQPEALQLNAQDIGRSFDRKLLCGWNFTLALVALVGVITFQSFSTEIMVQIVF